MEKIVMEDKVKQVIIVRKDLNMRKGKISSQVAHASMSFITDRLNRPFNYRHGDKITLQAKFSEEEIEWIEGSFTKIVSYVNSLEEMEDLFTKAEEAGLVGYIIIDEGATEFKGVPTRTALAIGPAKSSIIDPITKHLPLL